MRPSPSTRLIATGACAAIIVLGSVTVGMSASDPVVELKTETQKEALAKREIAVRAEVPRRSRVRARAKFSAGVSHDFRLEPQTETVGRSGATFHFPLSRKQRRIIAAAIDVCAPTAVKIRARALDLAGTPATRRAAELQRPPSC